MSCFGGRMQEYDRVSLDRFDSKNLQSTVYFLSHLHEDHTVGLAEKLFFKRLKSNKDIFLYCSEVTQVLLVASKKYHHLEPYIKPLDINSPTTIEIPDLLYEEKEKITVTLLPAFHCPGSVMFLIEGKEGTVLYTGDFRWEHFHIEQMHHLRSGESVKKIRSLYVDTTFCSLDSLHIPSRQQCIDAVCQLVQEWTSMSPRHVVNIYLRAQYGHEPLLNAVASRLDKKVHVNERKAAIYDRIQEFHGNFTADGASTQLHACDKDCMITVDGETILCREAHDADKVLILLPTTMYFTQFQHLTLDKIVKKVGSNYFRACYSFHSSYTEVKDLLSYLKPQRVYPNVKSPADSSLAVTQHRLNTMLKECMESGAGEVIQSEEVKELGALKTRSGRQVKKRKSRESDAESLDFGTPTKVTRYSFSSSLETVEPASTSESSVATRKGRGRGRGRGKSVTETASQPAVGTRRSTRRSAATPTAEDTTPKKAKKSERSPTPDLFLTPASDSSDQHSSFCGSERSDSELSLFSSQKSIDLVASSAEAASTWTAGSFLAAVSSSSEDDTGAGRFCLLDDVEQTDEQYQDESQFTDTEEEEEGNTTDNLTSVTQPDVEHEGENNIPTSDVVQSKGKPKSPFKRGNRGRKGKQNIQRKTDEDKTETTIQNTDSLIELGSMESMNLKSESVAADDQTCQSESNEREHLGVAEIDSTELSVSNDTVVTNAKDKEADPEVREEADLVKTDALETQAAENIQDGAKIQKKDEHSEDYKMLKYLGAPFKTADEPSHDLDKSMADRVMKTEENPSEIVDSVIEENASGIASSEDLHLHLSETTHGSEDSDGSDMHSKDAKYDEIVIIDSDSDEVDGVDQVNDTSTNINTEIGRTSKQSESEDSEGKEFDESKMLKEDEVMVVESDSNEAANSDYIGIDSVKCNVDDFKTAEQSNGQTNDNVKVEANQSCSENDEAVERDEKALEKLEDEVEQSPAGPVSSKSMEPDLLKSDSLQDNTEEDNIDKAASQITSRVEPMDNTYDGKSNQSSRSVEKLDRDITTKDDKQSDLLVSRSLLRNEDINDVNSSVQSISEVKIVPGTSEIDIELTDNVQKPEVVKDSQLHDNKDVKEDDDDDVIEIVDLTEDDHSGQLETQESLKPGKKTIKISLLNKPEPACRIKKVVENKERNGHQKSDSDSESDEEVEISSSPEWLSVKKAEGNKGKYDQGKAKKAQASKINKSRNKRRENVDVKESDESKSDFESQLLSKKELEERDEVRRQAVGFMCETDSDSDTDESSSPNSPAADMLYDDYVELSSDSDNEDGIGGKSKGERTIGRKSSNQRGTGSSGSTSGSGRSGSSTQGWLSARKNMDQSESTVQGTALHSGPSVGKDTDLETNKSDKVTNNIPMETLHGVPSLAPELASLDSSEKKWSGSSVEKDTSSERELSSVKEQNTRSAADLIDQTVQQETLLNKDTHLKTSQVTEKTINIVQEPDNTHLITSHTNQVEKVQSTASSDTNVDSARENVSDGKVNSDIAKDTSELELHNTIRNRLKDQSLRQDNTTDKEGALDTMKESEETREMQEPKNSEENTEITASTSQDFTKGKSDQFKGSEKTNTAKIMQEHSQFEVAEKTSDIVQESDNTLLSTSTDQAVSKSTLQNIIENKIRDFKTSDKNKCAQKTNTENVMNLQPELVQDNTNGSTSETPVLLQVSHASGSAPELSQKEKNKTLQNTVVEAAESSKIPSCDTTEQKAGKTADKCEDKVHRSGAKSVNNQTNENQQSSKKGAVLRTVPQAHLKHTPVFKVHDDQPPPPGMEEIHLPQQATKKISSLISNRRPVKGYHHVSSAPVTPTSSPAMPAASPLYNVFVTGGTYPPHMQHSPLSSQYAPYHMPHSAPAFPVPPPNWNRYNYGTYPPVARTHVPPPNISVPPPDFSKPPPNVSYPTAVPTTSLASTTPVISTSTVSSTVISTSTVSSTKSIFPFSKGAAVASVAPSLITTKYTSQDPLATTKYSSGYIQSGIPTTESMNSQIAATSTKSKKLAPWQQRKANLFDKGPSCIAKKEVAPKITINIGKPPSEQKMAFTNTLTQENEGIVQDNYEGQFSRFTQQSFEQKPESTDLSTIKANISALTGLSVASLENTPTSVSANSSINPSEAENVPELVEKLKKLEQMQAILEAVAGSTNPHATTDCKSMEIPRASRETFQYDNHSKLAEYHENRKHDSYDVRQPNRDRRSRDELYEREHRRSSYEYDRRDRDYGERSYEYERKERDCDDRYRSREHYDYERKGGSYDEYERRERDLYHRNRERDVDYDRDRDFARKTERAFEYDRERDFARKTERAVEYDRERDFARNTERAVEYNRERDFARKTERAVEYDRERDFARNTERAVEYNRERDFARKTERAVEYDRERDFARKTERAVKYDRERDFTRKTERAVEYDRERDFATYEQRERSYTDHSRREREFERRYREEEDYRRWVEEKRRNDYHKRDVERAPPPRYGSYGDRVYEDSYYDRPSTSRSQDLEYEKWREEKGRNYRDQLDVYDNPARPQPLYDRPDPQTAYDSQTPQRPSVNTEPDYGHYDGTDYGVGESVNYEGLETNPEQVYTGANLSNQPLSVRNPRAPSLEPVKKRPMMARVYSRSGQLISLQSASDAIQQAPASTRSEEKQGNTDVPVFLTGMNYYPTDQ